LTLSALSALPNFNFDCRTKSPKSRQVSRYLENPVSLSSSVGECFVDEMSVGEILVDEKSVSKCFVAEKSGAEILVGGKFVGELLIDEK